MRLRLLLSCFVCATLPCATLHAQSAEPKLDSEFAAEPQAAPDAIQSSPRTRAEELILQGVALRREGREQQAFLLFREAYALEPSPRARAQMALAAKSLRLYLEAQRYFEEALAAEHDPWISAHRETLEQAANLVDKQLGYLTVVTALPQVELLVNGRSLGKILSNTAVRVPAGVLALEIRSPGYVPHRASISIPAQRTATLSAVLVPEVAARQSAAPPAKDSGASSSGLPTLSYVGGALGIAGIGIGTYFGLRALSLKSERDDLCPTASCASDRGIELDQQGRRAAFGSSIAFGVGALGIGTTIIALLLDDKENAPTRELSVAASGQRVDVRFSF